MFPTAASISPESVGDEQPPATWSRFYRTPFWPCSWNSSWRFKMTKRKAGVDTTERATFAASIATRSGPGSSRREPPCKAISPESRRQKSEKPAAPLSRSWDIWPSDATSERAAHLNPIQHDIFHMFSYDGVDLPVPKNVQIASTGRGCPEIHPAIKYRAA